MTAIPFPGWQTSANGTTLASGAKIYFYVPGTVTPRTPFSDEALTTPTTNPVLLNASGWPATNIYLDSSLAYEYVVKSSDDATTYVPATVIPAAASGGGGDPTSASAILALITRDTYAELTAIAAADRFAGMFVYVAGRGAAGDGADGWWRFDATSSTTANAGTVLAPDVGTGRWFRQFEDGRYNVRWFGAVGNNSTNDDTAVAAAVAAIVTTGTYPGGVLYFPRGQYRLATTITLPDYTTIEGDGQTTSRLNFADQSSGVGITEGGQSYFLGVKDVMIENTFSHGIELTDTSGTRLENLYVLSCGGDGIKISGNAYMITIENVWPRQNTGIGINCAGYTTSIYMQNVHPLLNTSHGIQIRNATYTLLDNVGSDQSAAGYGFLIANVTCLVMDACAAERNEKSAMRFEASTAIGAESGTLYPDVHEVSINGFFSYENGQDTTSPGILECSSLNSKQIDITIRDSLDDGPVSGVSVVANGETRIVRHGGTLEGTYTLNDNAVLWAEQTRSVPAYGQHYLGGNLDTYINSVLVSRNGSAGTTFRGSTVGSAFFNLISTPTTVGAMGMAFKTSDSDSTARDYGFYLGDVSRGDFTLRRSSAAGGNPISGGVVMRFNSSGQMGIGTATPVAQVTVNGALALTDGMTAPSTQSGWAQIYVDTADGDLKIKFGDGTTKTIVTDT
jgi:hypothetical protein